MSKGKRLAAGNMGYGRTFYPDEPEDLAYLKQLAKETRGDENRWLELNLKIHGRPTLRDGEPDELIYILRRDKETGKWEQECQTK
jgi:hypothetical protein